MTLMRSYQSPRRRLKFHAARNPPTAPPTPRKSHRRAKPAAKAMHKKTNRYTRPLPASLEIT